MLALFIALQVMSVADAEQAFAAMAARDGQWTAFRATAADNATMFVPGPVKALDWLRGRADPVAAVAWVPDIAVTACDGSMAVTTGPYREPGGASGRFSTVWQRQADGGWKWVLDQGGPAPAKALEKVRTRQLKPDCRNRSKARERRWSELDMLLFMGVPGPPGPVSPTGVALADVLRANDMPLLATGASDDATLQWAVRGDDKGRRRMMTWAWDGDRFSAVLSQDTP